MIAFAWVCFGCSAIPALLYLWNSFLFREPPDATADPLEPLPRISVLIPARNEERGIARCLDTVLASRGVEFEVLVLDDHSADRTAEIVRGIAAHDARVLLEPAPPLPPGWCGKQHACFVLAGLAKFDLLCFLDADVRLSPHALSRLVRFQKSSSAALVSGFPRQVTGTFFEKLLIPLIHWLLLSFLPLWAMRRFRWSAFGAGCGQWFMTTRAAYEKVGGHATVKASLHDGLTLPRAYRRAGFFTDICDGTNLATCRMYRSGREVWFGLAKNAREGMAATGQIAFWTVVLLAGQVMPFALLAYELYLLVTLGWWDPDLFPLICLSAAAVCWSRWAMTSRFRQDPIGILHPIAILLLLAIQWYAIATAILGRPVGWKGRVHPRVAPK